MLLAKDGLALHNLYQDLTGVNQHQNVTLGVKPSLLDKHIKQFIVWPLGAVLASH